MVGDKIDPTVLRAYDRLSATLREQRIAMKESLQGLQQEVQVFVDMPATKSDEMDALRASLAWPSSRHSY